MPTYIHQDNQGRVYSQPHGDRPVSSNKNPKITFNINTPQQSFKSNPNIVKEQRPYTDQNSKVSISSNGGFSSVSFKNNSKF